MGWFQERAIKARANTSYNPNCDWCENCHKYGHEAEDCCNPDIDTVPDSKVRIKTKHLMVKHANKYRDEYSLAICFIALALALLAVPIIKYLTSR